MDGAPRRRTPLVLALAALTAFASMMAFGSPDDRLRPELEDGSVWLPSSGPGLLTQMNGVAVSPQFQLPVPALRGHDRMTVAEVTGPGRRAVPPDASGDTAADPRSLVVTDSSGRLGGDSSYSLVDPVSLRVEGPFAPSDTCAHTVIGSRVYCVAPERGELVEVTPGSPPAWERRTRLGGRLGQSAEDSDGTLWVALPSDGTVAAVRSGRGRERVRRTAVGEPGDQVWLTSVGGAMYAVNADSGHFVALTGEHARTRVPLPESVSGRDPVTGVGAASASAAHLVLLLRSGKLVSLDPRTGAGIAVVSTGVRADAELGRAFVEAGDLVHLPKGRSGRVLVADMRTGRLRGSIRVTTRASAHLRLVERAGVVWIHDPRGPEGVAVRRGKAQPFRKYETNQPPRGTHGGPDGEPSTSSSPSPTATTDPPPPSPTPSTSATSSADTRQSAPPDSPRPSRSGGSPSGTPSGTPSGSPSGTPRTGTPSGTGAPGTGGDSGPTASGEPRNGPSGGTGGANGPSAAPSYTKGPDGAPTRVATLPAAGPAKFRPDGSVIALGGDLWDISDPADAHRLGPLSAEAVKAGVSNLVFTPDGKTLFARSRYEIFVQGVEDPSAPVLLTRWVAPHSTGNRLELSADGRRLAYGFSDLMGRSGNFFVDDVSVPHAPRPFAGGGIQVQSPVWNTSLSADGNLIAVSLSSQTAILDLSGIAPGTEESGPGPAAQQSLVPKLREATFAPRGPLLVAAHDDGGWAVLSLENPADPRTVVRNTDVRDVSDFVFSEDGGRLAFMANDPVTGARTAQLWDMSRPERPRLIHRVPSSSGDRLDLDPTGRLLAVSGDDKTELWRFP
ncbi:hypothetical protein [Streptomyces phaeolivaceus]|uniref:hypothetical protein n=1 Tax=Streptomyces phaeolivaceus TaxID=2653200 RepID=UPI00186A5D53|nr:hypothetical protein [Streptomyces phaeolivaceus]